MFHPKQRISNYCKKCRFTTDENFLEAISIDEEDIDENYLWYLAIDDHLTKSDTSEFMADIGNFKVVLNQEVELSDSEDEEKLMPNLPSSIE